MTLRHHLAAAAVLGAALLATGCGGSTSNTTAASASPTGGSGSGGGSVSFTGDVSGTWSKAGEAKESTCGSAEAVIHIAGPASGDEGDLHVKSDGSVWLDAEKYGDFKATGGGTLKAGTGLSVNADIATERGKKTHVSGDLSC
jgi:hypothetical protein